MSKRYHRETINRLIEEVRRWGWNEGNEGRDFRRPKAVSEAIAALTAALQHPEASLPVEAEGDEELSRDALKHLLDGRDKFIVDHGLWAEFVASFDDINSMLASSSAQGGR